MASKGIIISLCDLTGIMVQPWVDNGYEAILVDPQHSYRTPTGVCTGFHEGGLHKLGMTILKAMPILRKAIDSGRVKFVAGFPECTDVAVSGARWWEEKRKEDPYFQAKASLLAEECRMVGELSGAPWFFENPVSAFSNIFGAPSYTFHPHWFTAHCADDNYTKKTLLWSGGGFVMPRPKMNPKLGPPDATRIHHASPGPNRKNERSATPLGFARAVYYANNPERNTK